MSDTWLTIAILAPATALIRASGPVALGGRKLPSRVRSLIALLAPALLAALVVTETFGDHSGSLVIDERVLGVAGAGLVCARRGPMLAAIGVAAVLTATARAL